MSGSGLDGIQTEDCTLCSFTEGLLGSFLPDDHYVLGFSVNLQTRVWLIGLRVVPGYV